MIDTPLISVVTVTYNCQDSIEETIESVISQTYKSVEYIIVDGLSRDRTIDIINHYGDEIDHLLIERDKGTYDAMNKAVDLASGEWIIFMNAGDVFNNNEVLDSVFNNSAVGANVGCIYGDTIIKSSVGEFYSCSNNPFFLMKSYVKTKGICHQSVFVQAKLAKKYKFDLKYKVAADFNMLYQIYKQGFEFKYKPIAISKYQVDDGISKQNQVLAWKEDAEITGISNSFRFKVWLLKKSFFYRIKLMISSFIKSEFPSFHSEIKRQKLARNIEKPTSN